MYPKLFDGLVEGKLSHDDSVENSLGPTEFELHIEDPFEILEEKKVCAPIVSYYSDQIKINIDEERYFMN